MKQKIPAAVILISVFFMLSSCLGLKMDIALNQNGSGTINLEYRISRSLDALGRLDGNERWNTIPVGKADFDRTVDRLPDIKLTSFSSKEDDKNLIINAKLDFTSIKGLLAFLDASGQRSSFSGDGRSGRLEFTLSEGDGDKSPELNELLAAISESYSVDIGMSFASDAVLNIKDNQGRIIEAGNKITARGKKVSCSFPLYEILSSSRGINVEVIW